MDFPPNKGDPAAACVSGFDTTRWIPVPIPGDIHTALLASGRIPDPHLDDNAKQSNWTRGRDWWLRTVLSLPPTRAGTKTDLCLEGIDGHAEIYLNGLMLGHTENAFRLYRFDVSPIVKYDSPNVLVIRIESVDHAIERQRQGCMASGYPRRTWLRKPQFNFGWDWSLDLPSAGIINGVWLEQHHGPRILDVGVQTFLSGRLDFSFKMNTQARDRDCKLILSIDGHGTVLKMPAEQAGQVNSYRTIILPAPRLWWPNGTGSQPLYDYSVELVGTDNSVLDRRTGRFGIREARLVEDPFTQEAGNGRSFWIEINGRKIFCKGANWVPLEMFPAAARKEQYAFYIRKAVEAGFNMLRVWGGGIYEREVFYDLCERHGIMVWQDFMFASSGYPVDHLYNEIAAEAEYQVKRLRNRPCIVLWCGCNEDVFSWSLPDEQSAVDADTGTFASPHPTSRLRDDPLLHSMILRGLVDKHAHGVPFVESSPQSRDDFGNQPQSGNSHLSCWKYALFQTPGGDAGNDKARALAEPRMKNLDSHPERFREHFDAVCSFNSEFCLQGPSAVSTMRRFLTPSHQWPPDDVWEFHIQRAHANLLLHEQSIFIGGVLFGEVTSLEEYVKHGQAAHAEMVRAEIESARRDWPDNGGTMCWMFNDCWPTANWSIIDYYRRPKPAYHAARRACAALLPIIFERRELVQFFFSNHSMSDCSISVRYGQEQIDGSTVWTGEFSTECMPSSETLRFHEMSRSELRLGSGDYLYVDAVVDGKSLPRVTYFPGLWRDVSWPRPKITYDVLGHGPENDQSMTHVRLSTDAYVRFCHLAPAESQQFEWISDNFFDLCAGASRDISIRGDRPLSKDSITIGHWLTDWP